MYISNSVIHGIILFGTACDFLAIYRQRTKIVIGS